MVLFGIICIFTRFYFPLQWILYDVYIREPLLMEGRLPGAYSFDS